jgi:hypothetical protein
MTGPELDDWFAAYLAEFAALGRGDVDDERLILAYYGVPMILSSDAGSVVLAGEGQVLTSVRQQITALRAAGYARTDELLSETTVLNRACALHRGRFARFAKGGGELGRLEATYLIIDGPAGPRISTLVVHSTE